MNKKPKILHTMTWLAKGGGVDNNVLLTIDGLKNEFEFHLAVGNEIYHNPFKEIEGIKFIICNDLVRPVNFFKDLKALIFFTKLIKKEKYDIVHTHEAKASLITRLAASIAGCRYIIYGLHGVTFNDPLSKFKRKFYIMLERWTVGASNLIIGVSKDVIHHYHLQNIGRKIPSKVIHSGINIEKFLNEGSITEAEKMQLKTSLKISSEDIVLINVGRFSFSKAQRFTIKSFAALKKTIPHLKLILVGEGELMEECKKLAEELGISNDVIFYGFSDRIGTLLSIADIHVLTSLREGLPRVAVEASLLKVPTVAFEVEGIREVITDAESGYLVPPNNVNLLTERIIDLIRDHEKRKIFGERASNNVKQKWDSKIMIQQLRETYNQALC